MLRRSLPAMLRRSLPAMLRRSHQTQPQTAPQEGLTRSQIREQRGSILVRNEPGSGACVLGNAAR